MQGISASLMRGIRRTRVPEADLPLVGWGYAMTNEGCVFCEIAADLEDPLVTRLGDVLVLPALKQRERNRGHMLVIPVPHVTRLSEATGSLIEQLYMTAGRVGVAMRRAFDATGTLLFQQYQIRAVERASAELPK